MSGDGVPEAAGQGTAPGTAPAPGAGGAGVGEGAPRRSVGSRIVGRLGSGAVQVVLVLLALFWLVPTLGLFIASLRSPQDNAAAGWWTALASPSQITLENYANLLDNEAFTGSFWNTILITVPATVIIVVIAALAAYAFAWLEFPGRDWLFLGVVGLLVVPLQVALVPIAQIYGALGIFGNIVSVVLFHVGFGLPFAIFLLRNFFAAIPRDLLEAARMDGGKEFTIFRRVILPLGGPAIASLAIFQFLWVWNDLLVALVFADQTSQPMTRALQSEMRQFGANIDVISAGAFLSMIVPLIVFFAFQRYFVQGVMAGAVK
ncbi:alpha-glucoside transport system permease protein [Murinocardiopsis flavida]|uniref:Alpha-glucoside transport system permease protein n=1 Tax=Murinocardiopsis flavida TaxID=645275 RepID=A0A2P8DLD6_9ACTN|nr:carbohydrate ABC transporter permease [Murinocardiopsis flavida]PSK98042.1 alpha-glucoside transport system permease protein [Murinocardiopsis flavida]